MMDIVMGITRKPRVWKIPQECLEGYPPGIEVWYCQQEGCRNIGMGFSPFEAYERFALASGLWKYVPKQDCGVRNG